MRDGVDSVRKTEGRNNLAQGRLNDTSYMKGYRVWWALILGMFHRPIRSSPFILLSVLPHLQSHHAGFITHMQITDVLAAKKFPIYTYRDVF